MLAGRAAHFVTSAGLISRVRSQSRTLSFYKEKKRGTKEAFNKE
jgi:hypothetical protein